MPLTTSSKVALESLVVPQNLAILCSNLFPRVCFDFSSGALRAWSKDTEEYFGPVKTLCSYVFPEQFVVLQCRDRKHLSHVVCLPAVPVPGTTGFVRANTWNREYMPASSTKISGQRIWQRFLFHRGRRLPDTLSMLKRSAASTQTRQHMAHMDVRFEFPMQQDVGMSLVDVQAVGADWNANWKGLKKHVSSKGFIARLTFSHASGAAFALYTENLEGPSDWNYDSGSNSALASVEVAKLGEHSHLDAKLRGGKMQNNNHLTIDKYGWLFWWALPRTSTVIDRLRVDVSVKQGPAPDGKSSYVVIVKTSSHNISNGIIVHLLLFIIAVVISFI
ncbi:hypothetical protein PG985_014942 [Apiospora marii]|uniref:Uncharacterized protein n=1 Tax=Apiospora marii TaxID=335849 RepID=A0ABR1RIR3_9PEZI